MLEDPIAVPPPRALLVVPLPVPYGAAYHPLEAEVEEEDQGCSWDSRGSMVLQTAHSNSLCHNQRCSVWLQVGSGD